MKSLPVCTFALVGLLTVSPAPAAAAEKLSDILQESGWEDIFGTWVDEQTGGADLKLVFAWKLEDRVVDLVVTESEKQTVAMIGVNAETGEVFHVGVDSNGGTAHGKWVTEANGDAVLKQSYTTGDGRQGEMNVRLHREDADTITVTVEVPDAIKVKLIRQKSTR